MLANSAFSRSVFCYSIHWSICDHFFFLPSLGFVNFGSNLLFLSLIAFPIDKKTMLLYIFLLVDKLFLFYYMCIFMIVRVIRVSCIARAVFFIILNHIDIYTYCRHPIRVDLQVGLTVNLFYLT